jgi:hypothetical protein
MTERATEYHFSVPCYRQLLFCTLSRASSNKGIICNAKFSGIRQSAPESVVHRELTSREFNLDKFIRPGGDGVC